MSFKGKHVLVIGSGISGIAAVNLLKRNNAVVTLYDGNKNLDKNKTAEKLEDGASVEIVLGEIKDDWKEGIDLIVMSPGVPTDLEFIKELQNAGIPVWGEIELAYQCASGKLCAITGTNGKTTTTALLGEIMERWKQEVFVVGNIGIPYTSIAQQTTEDSVTVAEVSSFQLETIKDFKPDVSAILNISPDHLNRHHTMENYIQAKMDIAKNQTADDTCVLNYDDEVTRRFGETVAAKTVYFSSSQALEYGVYLDGDAIYYNDKDDLYEICRTKELHLLGRHNYENIMAAAAMAIHAGVPLKIVKAGITGFKAVEHRIEYVAEKKGVVYYNDSKGTNPDAAIKGIQAMNRPTYLIGGGYDKESDFTEWIRAFNGKVKQLVLLGATREKIADTAAREGFLDSILVDTLEEAVKLCSERAERGDAVLLSPACASWGMFDNYEQRGNRFKELVCDLEG